nr:MAG TPA: hypothetical protein [Caudoviricetes sp.]
MFIDVATFIRDFREQLEDQTGDIMNSTIIANLRSSLSRLAREQGLDALFTYQDTFELGSMKEDGSPASAWTINGLKEDNGTGRAIGQIIDVKSLLILKNEDCSVKPVSPCYLPYTYFRRANPFPEGKQPGDPCYFTIQQIQGKTRIIFDKPINKPFAIDMFYSAFHPRITSTKDVIRIPVDYEDLLIEYVKTLYYEGTSDFASAHAVEDKIDYLVAQIREQLARNNSTLPLRQVQRSY